VLRTKIMPRMPESVLFSETLEATASDVTKAVKAQGLEGVIAKRRDSLYEPGRRSGAWVKMRVNKSRELFSERLLGKWENLRFDGCMLLRWR
jgi:bifunctional non-homologous end joining protein LigD